MENWHRGFSGDVFGAALVAVVWACCGLLNAPEWLESDDRSVIARVLLMCAKRDVSVMESH